MKRGIPFLTLMALLYLGVRLFILFSDFDSVALAGYELFPMGTLAKDVLEGGGYPLLGYCDTHSGGELVTGLFAVPAYLIMGSSYLALKMVPLAFGLGTMILLFLLLRHHFAPRAGVFGALLFALAPTTVTKHSIIAMGNHFEILFFVMVFLYCFHSFHFGGRKKAWLFATGLAAGFALFHNFSSALVIFLLASVHFGLRGYKKSLTDLLLLLPFFLLGILPLILINLGTVGGGSVFLSAKFGQESRLSLSRIGGRLKEFLFEHLPEASCFEGGLGLSGSVPGILWLAVFLSAYLLTLPFFLRGLRVLVRRIAGRESETESLGHLKCVPFLLYLPLLAIAYSAGDFVLKDYPHPHEVGKYRYFLTHFLFGIVLISVAAAQLTYSKKGFFSRAAGYLLFLVPLLLGFFNLKAVDLSFSHPASLGRSYEGYFYPQMARGLIKADDVYDVDRIDSAIQGFRPVFQSRVYEGIGALRALVKCRVNKWKGKSDNPQRRVLEMRVKNLDVPKLLTHVSDNRRIDTARGIGAYLRETVKRDRFLNSPEAVNSMIEQWKAHPSPALSYVLEGLMLNQDYILLQRSGDYLRQNEKIILKLPPPFMPHLWRGQGLICGRLLRRAITQELDLIVEVSQRVPEKQKVAFFFGLGWGTADGGDEPALPEAWSRIVPEDMRNAAFQGFGAAIRHLFGPGECKRLASELAVPKLYRDALEEGTNWENYPELPAMLR